MKINTIKPSSVGHRIDLQDLSKVELNEQHQQMVDHALAQMPEGEMWSMRKAQEIHDALAMAQMAREGDLNIIAIDATDDLRLLMHMHVPVPLMPKPGGELQVVNHAMIELRYPRLIMEQNLPGTAFIRVLQPRFIWLSNVDHTVGVGCLGKIVPRNTPCRELILLTHSVLSAQTQMNDEQDYAGVINRDAARWWALNPHRAPLTDRTLFDESPSPTPTAFSEKENA